MHLALLLDMVADALPDRCALGTAEDGLSFGALAAQARAGAAWVHPRQAQTLAYVGLNSPALAVAAFAAFNAGLPFAPLNYRLPDDALSALLARTAPAVAIVDDDMLARIGVVAGVEIVARSVFMAACLDLTGCAAPELEIEPDVAVLLFTSGTTGEPKAAMLRHRHLAAYVISTVAFADAEGDEAALVSVPPYHIAGISALLTGVYAGRRTVHLPSFSPEAWIAAAQTEEISQAMVVPTMLGRILDELERREATLPHLRALSYGGGRMPLPVIERALRLLPQTNFVNAYGLTETSSTIAVLGAEDHRAAIASADPAVRRRLGSVGKPLPSVEIEIRDAGGARLPPLQKGEIYVRGEQVAGEYQGRRMTSDDGWFATNDGGWMDDDGYLFVDGRLDDVIVRGGENISPGEIEDVLRAHPSVTDAAVLGLPDDQWGEKIAAVVVLGEAPAIEADLSAWVKARLRSTKTPERWVFRDALPYNDAGKLLRRVLRAELA